MKIGNKLSIFNIFTKKKTIVGLQLSKSFTRIAILQKDGEEFKIPAVPFELNLPDDIEDTGNLIKDELQKREIFNVSAVVGLPPSSLFFKTLKVPKDEKSKIADVVKESIKEDINTIQGDTYYDFQIISENEDYLDILVVIARMTDIERIRQICEYAGINLEIIDAEPISLINLASFNIENNQSKEENICIVHLDANESYLVFSHKNVIVQSLNFDSNKYNIMSPDERETAVENLVNEINYFFLTIHEPKIIFMSGDSFKFPEIKAYMQLKFGNRFDLVDLDPVSILKLEYSGNIPLGIFNVPISLAFRGFFDD